MYLLYANRNRKRSQKLIKLWNNFAFIAKSRDPETTDVVSAMSIIAKTNTFDSDVSEALIIMEETLHEGKDKDKPAAGKQTLRELLVRHAELASKAA